MPILPTVTGHKPQYDCPEVYTTICGAAACPLCERGLSPPDFEGHFRMIGMIVVGWLLRAAVPPRQAWCSANESPQVGSTAV